MHDLSTNPIRNIIEYSPKQTIEFRFADRLYDVSCSNTVRVTEGDIISCIFADCTVSMDETLNVVRGRVESFFNENGVDYMRMDYSRNNESNVINIPLLTIQDIQDVNFNYVIGFQEHFEEQAWANLFVDGYLTVEGFTPDNEIHATIRKREPNRLKHEESVYKLQRCIREL